MPSAEIAEAAAFERLEPDPLDVLVLLMARVAAVLTNMWERPSKPHQPADFLPRPVLQEAEERAVRTASQRWTDALSEMRANYAQRSKRKN